MTDTVPYWIPERTQTREGNYTGLEVEAAMCVWECICEWTLTEDKEDDPYKEWKQLRDRLGSGQMRLDCIELGLWCLEIDRLCTEMEPDYHDGYSWDWEVVPHMLWMIATGHNSEPTTRPSELPDPASVAPAVYAHFRIERSKH